MRKLSKKEFCQPLINRKTSLRKLNELWNEYIRATDENSLEWFITKLITEGC